MAETTITRNSQITLTKDIREKLGLKEGDVVTMNTEGDRIILEKRNISVFRNAGRFLPDNFEEMLKFTRSDYRKRLERLGIIR